MEILPPSREVRSCSVSGVSVVSTPVSVESLGLLCFPERKVHCCWPRRYELCKYAYLKLETIDL